MSDNDNDDIDRSATNLGEPPKDGAGMTGGAYADPDPNPAFHGQEGTPATEGDNPELPAHTAYEDGAAPAGGHVAL